MNKIYTIGHSTHASDAFVRLLSIHCITAVCDVRSSPYSKFNPQFNRETIRRELKRHGISYVFLGKELGPRSDDPACYENGKVQYSKLAETDIFSKGIDRLKNGMKSYHIALMCSEKDPITCHRMILICRHLRSHDIEIQHILEDGRLENNRDSEKRLMEMLKIPPADLFDSEEDLIQRAYDKQSERIAYIIKETEPHE
ncbi:DUF488 domain-containing protein [Desulfonema magnum]|uniref:DUF488 n=1 Tax=Desulfonema magnum TaxID=45655 RepID=A0A975GTH0_9BACT|nr:DUF488 domain-containing protein [Desulfonema magnum]QTA93071.1 DUF488 [Desulfonema magnum]